MESNQKPKWLKILGWTTVVAGIGSLARWQWDSIASPAITALRELWKSHPLTATAVIGVATALLYGLSALGAGIQKKLKEKWVDSVADWIDAQVRLYGSLLLAGHGLAGFRSRYYKQLIYRHRFFNVRGLRTRGEFTPELEKVFVELSIAPQSVQAISADLLRREGLAGQRNVFELLVSDHATFRTLAIIGAPGSGKTTLLQHLSLVFAQNQQRRHHKRCKAFVPILLFLRSHAEAITSDDPPDLAKLVTDFENRERLKPPASWFERQLRKGKALVMLDGLDEVPVTNKRRQVVDWVAKQAERYGASRFLVTSRPHGYKTAPLPAATVLEVQPFSLEQVERFVRSWYLANEVLSSGKDDPGICQLANKQAEELMQRLFNTPTLAALALNPLLLTMIALVHRYRGALPGRRVELYAEICDVLLGHWQTAKGLAAMLTPAQRRAVLQPLAGFMMSKRKRELPSHEAARVIEAILQDVQGSGLSEAQEFLKEIETASGLLVEREFGVYSFSHLTFQEYLAAVHFLENRDKLNLVNKVSDPWWHETVRLYAAQTDATPVVRACLDAAQPNVQTLTLAYECQQEARSVDAAVRAEIEQTLIDGLEARQADHRKLAAEVMLELRLRNLLRVNETVEIDTAYVSCAEYQVFVDEMRVAGEHRKPDHWSDFHFEKGAAQQPITGVRYSDAERFCEWLTRRAGLQGETGTKIRLPKPEEAIGYPVSSERVSDRFDLQRSDSVGSWADSRTVIGVAEDVRLKQQRILETAFEISFAHEFELGSELTNAHRRGQLDTNAQAVDLDLDLARDHARSLARDLTRAFTRTHARNFALARDSALAFDRGLDRNFNRDLQLAHELAVKLARALSRALKVNLDLGSAYSFARALTRDHKFGLALDRDNILDRSFYILLILSATIARKGGQIPAWEGIRIVRERVP